MAHIGLYTKQVDLIEGDPNRLPGVGEVNVQMGRVVVGVLVQGDARAAMLYAYELYRRFPDDFDAHMGVIESFGMLAGKGATDRAAEGRTPRLRRLRPTGRQPPAGVVDHRGRPESESGERRTAPGRSDRPADAGQIQG